MSETNAVFSFGVALGAGMASIAWGVLLFFVASDRARPDTDEFHGDQY